MPGMVSDLALKIPELVRTFTGKDPNEVLRELSRAVRGKEKALELPVGEDAPEAEDEPANQGDGAVKEEADEPDTKE